MFSIWLPKLSIRSRTQPRQEHGRVQSERARSLNQLLNGGELTSALVGVDSIEEASDILEKAMREVLTDLSEIGVTEDCDNAEE